MADPQHVPVTLPLGTWLGVEQALRNQVHELRRSLSPEQPVHVTQATAHALAEITAAIDAITDATASV